MLLLHEGLKVVDIMVLRHLQVQYRYNHDEICAWLQTNANTVSRSEGKHVRPEFAESTYMRTQSQSFPFLQFNCLWTTEYKPSSRAQATEHSFTGHICPCPIHKVKVKKSITILLIPSVPTELPSWKTSGTPVDCARQSQEHEGVSGHRKTVLAWSGFGSRS